MNYYIQGNKEKADEIKAAFDKLGCKNTNAFNFEGDDKLYFTFNDKVDWSCFKPFIDIIKTHPDYKELKLPKTHYDISNFKPFDKVLVRDNDRDKWRASIFSYHIKGRQTSYPFCCIGNSFSQCIPYEGNEHLLGTTDMPSEEYINW